MAPASHSVIIIGGGISGTAAAYELAKRGVDVTVIERGDLHAMGSGWTLAGVRQSGRHPAELPLAKYAVERWATLQEELGEDVEYRQSGNLRLAFSHNDMDVIHNVVSNGLSNGIEMQVLDGVDAVHAIAPAVRDDVLGASWCPTDGHANNVAAVRAYAKAATERGAKILTNTHVEQLLAEGDRVVGVNTRTGEHRADVVVVAAGIYTPNLLAPLGLDLPLRIVLDPVIQTIPVSPFLEPVLGVAGGGFAGRQEVSGRMRFIGSTTPWEPEFGLETPVMPTVANLQQTVNQAVTMLPGLADMRIERVWGGLIDNTPDVIPVLDRPDSHQGLIVAAGFSGHGFGIGPATGTILADLATTGTSSLPIDAFRLDRFTNTTGEQPIQLHG